MNEPSRKLAAVLHADVCGYGVLMQRDERATHRALTESRNMFSQAVSVRNGRIVNAPGDSVLAEFPSVVDAVQCAIDVQAALEERNAALPEPQRMLFRIGINLGEILQDGTGIYGDGVNVAARLESIADPGGVCISSVVFDQVEGKLHLPFEDMGERELKNVLRPIRAYRLKLGSGGHAASSPPVAATRPVLSIVVLPFDNLSDSPEQDYLADGITDDLTTDLSRIGGSFVISRNSAFTYKGKPVDIKRVGRELDVQYALEGSVRRVGNHVRVNAQLIETESGAHVWAERFDREMGDLLALQDDITGSIARVLRFELIEAESRRSMRERPHDPQALDCALHAQATIFRDPMLTRESSRAARILYEEALRLDPNLVMALAGLAGTWLNEVALMWTDEPEAALARAEALNARAQALAPHDARVLQTRGVALLLRRKPELALPFLQEAQKRDPNATQFLLNLGWCMLFLGEPEAALDHLQRAERLDPRGFNRGNRHAVLGTAMVYLERYEEAIRFLRLTCEELPVLAFVRFMLASAYALSGQSEEARSMVDEFRRMRPGVGIEKLRKETLSDHQRYRELRERVYEGLRLAGLED